MENTTATPIPLVSMETDVPLCYNTTREVQVLDMLHYVHAFFASLSILGSLSVIVYALCKRVVRTLEVRPLFHLALADLGLAVCWLVGAILWNIPFDGVGSADFQVCAVLQSVTEMFNVISFFLTVNYALNVYLRIKDRLNKAQRLTLLHSMTSMKWIMRLCYIISWAVPIAVMTPVLAVYHQLRAQDPCTECLVLFFKPSVKGKNGTFESWSWAHYGALFFVISLMLSMISIVVFYVSSAVVYRQLMKKNDKQRKALVDLCKRISLYVAVFSICWIPALVLNIMDLIIMDEVSLITYDWLYVLQGVTAPSQGFLNCFIYGWTRATFRMAKPSQDARPILRETYRIYGTERYPKTIASRHLTNQSGASEFSDDTSLGGPPMTQLKVTTP